MTSDHPEGRYGRSWRHSGANVPNVPSVQIKNVPP